MALPVEKWSFLAGLRFLLASIVVFTHLGHYAGAEWASALGSAAFEAIAGFLIISGFSIGDSYQERPNGFYLRRVERIYPAYTAGLLLNIAAVGMPAIGLLAANFLLLNQLVTTQSWLGPAWSLSLEVWLYALTPLLAKLPRRTLLALAGASFAAYCGYLAARPLLDLPYFAGVGFGANLVLLSFFWLAGFALGTQEGKPRTLAIICLMLAAHIGLSFALQGAYRLKHNALDVLLWRDVPLFLWRSAVLALVAAAFWMIVSGRIGKRRSHTLILLGDISYALYVVHVPVMIIALGQGVSSPPLLLAACLAAAALTVWIFEAPIRRLRRKPSAIATV
jgi:peptidoglycan/LPS O-acetylase OafA/YrhL